MKIEIDVPFRISIPSSKILEVHQALLAIRKASDDPDDETSFLNRLITQIGDKALWLAERQERMREREEWEKKERQPLLEETRKQQKQRAQSEPSSPSSS